MANSIYDKLIGQGLNPGEAGIFLKGIERVAAKNKTDVNTQFNLFIENMWRKNVMETYALSPISTEDIKQIAKDLKFNEPNEMQLDEMVLLYPSYQENDPTGPWFAVVESLLYDIMDEKYDFCYAISTEEIEEIGNKLNKVLTPEMVREVKNLYYQCEEIDKERNKGNLLLGYTKAVIEYL